jgi:hypothetical protein
MIGSLEVSRFPEGAPGLGGQSGGELTAHGMVELILDQLLGAADVAHRVQREGSFGAPWGERRIRSPPAFEEISDGAHVLECHEVRPSPVPQRPHDRRDLVAASAPRLSRSRAAVAG